MVLLGFICFKTLNTNFDITKIISPTHRFYIEFCLETKAEQEILNKVLKLKTKTALQLLFLNKVKYENVSRRYNTKKGQNIPQFVFMSVLQFLEDQN